MSSYKYTHYVVSPWGVAWEWHGVSQQNTGTRGFVSVGIVGGTSGVALGSSSVPSGRCCGGPLKPCSGHSCARGPKWIRSVKYVSPLPEYIMSGTEHLSLDRTLTASYHPTPILCGAGVSA